jgi:hypothetical protein
MGMKLGTKQVSAAVLALTAADVGVWAYFAPRSFYASFPSFGRHWISPLGPYNEHLTRDVGALYLALLAISVWAVARPQAENMRLVGVAWLTFSVPHLAFHLLHLDMFNTVDQVGNVVSLGGAVALPALLLAPARVAGNTDTTGKVKR